MTTNDECMMKYSLHSGGAGHRTLTRVAVRSRLPCDCLPSPSPRRLRLLLACEVLAYVVPHVRIEGIVVFVRCLAARAGSATRIGGEGTSMHVPHDNTTVAY